MRRKREVLVCGNEALRASERIDRQQAASAGCTWIGNEQFAAWACSETVHLRTDQSFGRNKLLRSGSEINTQYRTNRLVEDKRSAGRSGCNVPRSLEKTTSTDGGLGTRYRVNRYYTSAATERIRVH